MKLNKLTQLIALSMTLLGASTFAASNDALLDLLVQKGVLTESEATSVAAELKEADKAEKGVEFSVKGKETVKLQFSGRMQAQYDSLSGSVDGVDTPSTNHFYFRRLFLGVKATLDNGIYAETVLDFADGGASFDKASFGYKFDDALNMQLGYQAVPFGIEETSSSASLLTIERSAANRFFADQIKFSAKHAGIHANGKIGGGFSYATALTNGAQGEGSKLGGSAEGSNDLALYGRLQWKNDNVTLGVDGGVSSNNDKLDGSKIVDDVTAFTGYVNYQLDGLNLLGEYFNADLNTEGDVNAYSLRASYRMGKWEPVVRFSRVESDSFTLDPQELIRRAPSETKALAANTGNEIDSYYFGANYYFSKAVTFMTGYEIAEAKDDAGTDVEIDGLRARVQVLW